MRLTFIMVSVGASEITVISVVPHVTAFTAVYVFTARVTPTALLLSTTSSPATPFFPAHAHIYIKLTANWMSLDFQEMGGSYAI